MVNGIAFSNRVAFIPQDEQRTTIYHLLFAIYLFKNFVERLRELVHAPPPLNPARGDERARGEALARARRVREQNLIGLRVEADAVCARNMSGARRGDGDFGVVTRGEYVAQTQRRARWRVALARVVRLLYERRVVVEAAEEFSRARDDSIKEVDAHREVRAVDQRAVGALDCASDLFETRVPAGRSLDERDARERARFGVSRHGLGHCEVNDSVVSAEYLGQPLRAERRLAPGQH